MKSVTIKLFGGPHDGATRTVPADVTRVLITRPVQQPGLPGVALIEDRYVVLDGAQGIYDGSECKTP